MFFVFRKNKLLIIVWGFTEFEIARRITHLVSSKISHRIERRYISVLKTDDQNMFRRIRNSVSKDPNGQHGSQQIRISCWARIRMTKIIVVEIVEVV